nr:MAG TPA: hypothetical protein [Caudoviricetes sp.]
MFPPCSAPAAGASSSRSSTASGRRAGQQSRFSTTPNVLKRSRDPSQRPKRQQTIPRRGCANRLPSYVCCRTSLIWSPQPSEVKTRTRAQSRQSSSHSRTLAPITFTTSATKR